MSDFEELYSSCASLPVNSDRYVEMLQTFLKPKLDELGYQDVWFQQGGHTAHTSKKSMEVLREMFPQRLISQRGDVEWPARSNDLAPCDFLLWGYLKAKVYSHQPKTTEEIKTAIRSKIAEIPPQVTSRAMQDFRKRLQRCIAIKGHHLDGIIFKN